MKQPMHINPFLITGLRNNAVLVAQEDWNAIQETLHLMSIPGMTQSITEGSKEPVEECIRLEELKLDLANSANETGG